MPQEAPPRKESRGRASRAKSQRALHVSDTNSPTHSGGGVDGSAVQPKVAKAALGNFFEKVFEPASKDSSHTPVASDNQSRGAYSTVSKMAASKKSHRSSETRDKKTSKEHLGSFLEDIKAKAEEPEENDDQSRGAYSTVSKMKKSNRSGRSKSRSRKLSQKPSSKDLSTDKKSEAPALRSFIHDNTLDDAEVDIEVQSAQVGGSASSRRSKSRSGNDRLASRKKRVAPAADSKKGPSTKEELVALFRSVSSPSDYMMTDEIRHEVGQAENWTSRIADEDKVLAYGKEKIRTADLKGTRSRSIGIDQEDAAETNDRSIATLIKSVKARSQPASAAPGPDERKTQTASRTGQRQSQSSNRSPAKSQPRSQSRTRRSSRHQSPTKRDRSKSRSRRNNDESTADVTKSPRPKSRSSKHSDELNSDAMKSPRPKSGSRRHSVESGKDAMKSPRPKSGSRRNSVESNSEAMKMYRRSDRESGPSSKDSGRRHKDHKDAPRQKSSRRLADKEGDAPASQRQKSSRRLVEGPPKRQSSSRRLTAKDSPNESVRSAHENLEGIPRRSKHSSSRRGSNEEPSTQGSNHSTTRRFSNEERSTHSSNRRLSNEDHSSSTSSAKLETHKSSSHQRQNQKLVIDAPINEDALKQSVNYFEQDIFSLYTWSSAQTDPQRIQRERKILKDSLRDSPLFRVFPHQCRETL